jgi:uroporphyrinogen-III synthase
MSSSGHRKPAVALPETRQLDVLAELLERRDVDVVRCPLVAIQDHPDQAAVAAWLRRFVDAPPDLFVVYTGEGIYRLLAAAERIDLRDAFVAALARTGILARGPKPARALRTVGIVPTHAAPAPTTAGLIAALESMDLVGKRIAVQFFGAEPTTDLVAHLTERGLHFDAVMPYVYASETGDLAVVELIRRIAAGEIDAIAFTSKAQVDRLRSVAAAAGVEHVLEQGLATMVVAAVGPVVADELRAAGFTVDVVPEDSFFMKPMVTRLVAALQRP